MKNKAYRLKPLPPLKGNPDQVYQACKIRCSFFDWYKAYCVQTLGKCIKYEISKRQCIVIYEWFAEKDDSMYWISRKDKPFREISKEIKDYITKIVWE